MLLDSNIFVYAVLPKYDQLRRWCEQQVIWASHITRLEVLGYHRLNQKDKDDLGRLFNLTGIYPVSSEIIERAIALRQKQKMSLGDALVAATALECQQTLATRNIKDFDWVEGLKLVDPLSELY